MAKPYAGTPYINPSETQRLEQQKYLAKIELNTQEELAKLLSKAKTWSQTNKNTKPIAFVLHGKEAELLLQSNYSSNMEVLDLAKQLSDDNIIEVQVCKTWMFFNGYNEEDFANFVSTTPFAPSEIDKLIKKEGYTYF